MIDISPFYVNGMVESNGISQGLSGLVRQIIWVHFLSMQVSGWEAVDHNDGVEHSSKIN